MSSSLTITVNPNLPGALEMEHVAEVFETETNLGPLSITESEKYNDEIVRAVTTLDQRLSFCSFDWKRVNHLREVDQRVEHLRFHVFKDDGIIFTINPFLYHFSCQDEARALCQHLRETIGSSSITLMDSSFIKLLIFDLEKLEKQKRQFFQSRTTEYIIREKKKLELSFSTVSVQTHTLDMKDTSKSCCVTVKQGIQSKFNPPAPDSPAPSSHKQYSSIDFCATIGEVSKQVALTGSAEEIFKKSADLIKSVEGFSDKIYQMKKIGKKLELSENEDKPETTVRPESKQETYAPEMEKDKEFDVTAPELESKQETYASEMEKDKEFDVTAPELESKQETYAPEIEKDKEFDVTAPEIKSNQE